MTSVLVSKASRFKRCFRCSPPLSREGGRIITACRCSANLPAGCLRWPCCLCAPKHCRPKSTRRWLRAKLPRDAIALLVVDAEGKAPPRLSHRAGVPVNPASIAKLATTFAALDLLGPAFTWSTPVYVDGSVRDGTLHGNLYIKGQGDPETGGGAAVAAAAPRAGPGHSLDRGRHRAGPQRLRNRGARPRRLRRRAAAAVQRRARRAADQFQVAGDDLHATGRRRKSTWSRRWPAWQCRPACRCSPAGAATGAAP